MMRFRSAALAAALALTACGGGGHTSGTLPGTATISVKNVSANATLTIPSPTTAAGARRAQYVSASTNWITFAVNGGVVQGFDASISSPNCTPVMNGRTCSFTISLGTVIAGQQSIAVQTFTANPTPGPATLLSENTASVTVTAGQNTVALPLVLEGVAAAATVSVTPATLTMGTSATVPVTLSVTDPAGNTIIGNAPFDNAATVQLSVGFLTGTLTATPMGQSGTNGINVTIASPSTAVTLNYNGGPGLDIFLTGTLVRPSSTNITLARTIMPIQLLTSNVVDHIGAGYAPTVSQPIQRGPDGTLYFNGSNQIGRVSFQSDGYPTASACSLPGGTPFFTVSNASLGFAFSGSGGAGGVSSFPLVPFPGTCMLTTQATFMAPDQGTALAANSSGVYAMSIGTFVSPGSGSPILMSGFNSTTGAVTTLEQSVGYSTNNPILYGDPANAYAASSQSNTYGENLAGYLFSTVPTGGSPGSLVSIPAADGVQSGGYYTFGMDPNSNNVYLLDTAPYTLADYPASAALINAETGTQIGPSLTFTSGQPVVAADGRIFVVSGSQIAEYLSSSNTWQYISLSSSIGDIGLNSAVLGADGRLWCISGDTYVVAFPGNGTAY
jgi:hypothetical protein